MNFGLINKILLFSSLVSIYFPPFFTFFLLLFSSVTRVIGFSRKVGFWLVPGALIAIFVLFTWITKFTGEISQKGGKKGAIIPLQIEFSEPGVNRPQDPESTKPREIGPVANPIRRS